VQNRWFVNSLLRKWAKTKGKQHFPEVDPGAAPVVSVPIFFLWDKDGAKIFLA
jgi:hypothetical protein